MVYFRNSIVATLMGLSALCFSAAQAGPVTWGLASNINGDNDVSTNGSLVGAYNFGTAADTTVNGVLFKGLLIGAPPIASVIIDGVHTLAADTLVNFSTGSGVGTFFLALTSGYRSLLGSAAGAEFGDRMAQLTLGDLTIGQVYEFQAWFNVSSTVGRFAYGLWIGDGVSSVDLSPSTQRAVNNDYIEGGTGQFVIGTFVADASTKLLNYQRGEVGGGINGFQLRALAPLNVPEPGTAALVCLAAAGLAWSRRRSSQRAT